jgi:hypothetical protein
LYWHQHAPLRASTCRRAGGDFSTRDPRGRSGLLLLRAKASKESPGGGSIAEVAELGSRVRAHEMDHLNGILILDRATRDERKRALRELRDAERAREREKAA